MKDNVINKSKVFLCFYLFLIVFIKFLYVHILQAPIFSTNNKLFIFIFSFKILVNFLFFYTINYYINLQIVKLQF